MPPRVIPIFISHQGCPHRCIFCDQYTITGHTGSEDQPLTAAKVQETIVRWLKRFRAERNVGVQVAFYGGSFTGLPIQRQKTLLGAVRPYIAKGLVDFIRISTRPDYIDETTILLLQEYGVVIVEVGVQSLDQDVLEASARGHTAKQSEAALRLLKEKGFTVGAQIMCGLPSDTTNKLMTTARKVAALAPDFVRIYPALVIKGSGLEKMYRDTRYQPLSLPKAIALAGRVKTIFDQHDIRVVRMGLQPSEELAAQVVSGPYHPSFGELVIARNLFKKSREALRRTGLDGPKRLVVATLDESAFRGPHNVNMKRLTALNLLKNTEVVFVADQPRNSVQVHGLF